MGQSERASERACEGVSESGPAEDSATLAFDSGKYLKSSELVNLAIHVNLSPVCILVTTGLHVKYRVSALSHRMI